MTITLALLLAAAHGASVTVRPGDDLGSLTSSLIAGDVVTFTPGTYELEGTLNLSGIGTQVQPIRFVAQGGGNVLLRNNGGGWVVNLTGSDWVEIRGLDMEGGGKDIKKTRPSGLRIANSTQVTVRDCSVENVWGALLRIEGETRGITIERNELAFSLNGEGMLVGTFDGGSWMQDSLITNNLVHDVAGAGMRFLGNTQANLIEHNVIFNTGGDGMILPDTGLGDQNEVTANALWQIGDDGLDISGSALVQSNVIFEVGDDGIVTNDNEGSLVNTQISHNTVVRSDDWAALLNGWYDAEGMVFANNALANPTGRGFRYDDPKSFRDKKDPPIDDTTNFISNNVVTGLVEGFEPLVRPTWIIEGGGVSDFVDIDNFDFYPSPSSVLLGAGNPDGQSFIPLTDFNGAPRNGASPDAGAYEYDISGNPGWAISEDFKEVGDVADRRSGSLSRGCCNRNNSGTLAQGFLLGPLLGLGVLARRRRRR